MSNAEFTDAVLVLAGHGSTQESDASDPVYLHAAVLRGRGLFAEVREAFWKQAPRLVEVVEGLSAPRVFIVPMFISEGYFSEDRIPRALGLRGTDGSGWERVRRRGQQTVFYCAPVGTHPDMTRIILARAQQVVAAHPFPCAPNPGEIALFIAGHGTEKNANSRQAIQQQVEVIRAMGLYREVYSVFLEEKPSVADCYGVAQAENLVVVPFFISDGLHAREDIPVLLGGQRTELRERWRQGQWPWRNPTERHSKRVWCSSSVGTEPMVAEVILERVRAAASA